MVRLTSKSDSFSFRAVAASEITWFEEFSFWECRVLAALSALGCDDTS